MHPAFIGRTLAAAVAVRVLAAAPERPVRLTVESLFAESTLNLTG